VRNVLNNFKSVLFVQCSDFNRSYHRVFNQSQHNSNYITMMMMMIMMIMGSALGFGMSEKRN